MHSNFYLLEMNPWKISRHWKILRTSTYFYQTHSTLQDSRRELPYFWTFSEAAHIAAEHPEQNPELLLIKET